MSDFFPFILHAEETRHFTSSAEDFQAVFAVARKRDVSWYAYDVEIKSPTKVTFSVFGMRDTCYGGIGEFLYAIDAEVLPRVTLRAIKNEALRRAANRRELELIKAERAIVLRYADELLKDLGIDPEAIDE